MKAKRPKLVAKTLEKREQKLLRRIDQLQRNLLTIRSLQIQIANSLVGSQTVEK